MKICFPIVSDQGMESRISDHFGSAPALLVVDTESGTTAVTIKSTQPHEHGRCNPLKGLSDTVEAVAVKGIGGGALNELMRAGLKVFRADGETVADNLACFAEENLPELSTDQVCGGHGHRHGCGHH